MDRVRDTALQRYRELLAGIVGLRQSLRGGPGYRGPKSDHFDGQRFFNPGGASAGKSFGDFLRWRRTSAPRPWPVWREYPPALPPPNIVGPDDVAVTFINHVTFLVRFADLTLLTDPVYALRASPVQWAGPRRVHPPGLLFEQLPNIDVVFVSHNHYDHMDLATLRRLNRVHAPLFVTGLGNGTFLRQQGLKQVIELDWWQQTRVRGTDLQFMPAQHWSSRGPGGRNHTLWGGLWMRNKSRRVYFAGDTGYASFFSEIRQRCGQPDLALLPIGAYEPRWFMRDQHMNPQEAVRAHLDLGALISVAMHFGCFQLTDEGIDEPLVELQRAREALGVAPQAFHAPQPGETLLWRPGGYGLHVVA